MHWEWIVPVIMLAVWILASLVKSAEDGPKQPKPGEQLPDGAPPRPQSEVDRFLEEINRMRRRQEEEQRQPEPPRRSDPVSPPTPPPVVAVLVEPKPVEPTTAPDFEKPAAPVGKPRTRLMKSRRAESRTAPPRQPVVIVEASPPHVAPCIAVPEPSQAVAQLRAMLRSPQSIQAAILLREVLGPPRCRRRR